MLDAFLAKERERIDRPREAAILAGDLTRFLVAECANSKPFDAALRFLIAEAQADADLRAAIRAQVVEPRAAALRDDPAAARRRGGKDRDPDRRDRRRDLAPPAARRAARREFRQAARRALALDFSSERGGASGVAAGRQAAADRRGLPRTISAHAAASRDDGRAFGRFARDCPHSSRDANGRADRRAFGGCGQLPHWR